MNSLLKLQVEELGNSLSALPERDRAFAASLCEQFWRRGLSDKQQPWVARLLERAKNPPAERAPAGKVGDLSGVLTLFKKAKEHLKWPAIVLAVPVKPEALKAVMGTSVKLSERVDEKDNSLGFYALARVTIAGEKARVPGSLNVTEHERDEMSDDRRRPWIGRVLIDGSFEPGREYVEHPLLPSVTEALTRFAREPAKVAKESATLTGRCCFCNTALSDERSTAVGYGSICASHFGMPWGERPEEFAGAPVLGAKRKRKPKLTAVQEHDAKELLADVMHAVDEAIASGKVPGRI